MDSKARLPGFIKRTTIHCYTQNMKVLSIVVSDKFFMFASTMAAIVSIGPLVL